jgi:hypothetical protein
MRLAAGCGKETPIQSEPTRARRAGGVSFFFLCVSRRSCPSLKYDRRVSVSASPQQTHSRTRSELTGEKMLVYCFVRRRPDTRPRISSLGFGGLAIVLCPKIPVLTAILGRSHFSVAIKERVDGRSYPAKSRVVEWRCYRSLD